MEDKYSYSIKKEAATVFLKGLRATSRRKAIMFFTFLHPK